MAAALYVLGLIAPLTPSEGVPELLDVLLFAALPVVLLAIGTVVARSAVLRLLLVIEAGGIVAFTLHLLRLQGAL